MCLLDPPSPKHSPMPKYATTLVALPSPVQFSELQFLQDCGAQHFHPIGFCASKARSQTLSFWAAPPLPWKSHRRWTVCVDRSNRHTNWSATAWGVWLCGEIWLSCVPRSGRICHPYPAWVPQGWPPEAALWAPHPSLLNKTFLPL